MNRVVFNNINYFEGSPRTKAILSVDCQILNISQIYSTRVQMAQSAFIQFSEQVHMNATFSNIFIHFIILNDKINYNNIIEGKLSRTMTLNIDNIQVSEIVTENPSYIFDLSSQSYISEILQITMDKVLDCQKKQQLSIISINGKNINQANAIFSLSYVLVKQKDYFDVFKHEKQLLLKEKSLIFVENFRSINIQNVKFDNLQVFHFLIEITSCKHVNLLNLKMNRIKSWQPLIKFVEIQSIKLSSMSFESIHSINHHPLITLKDSYFSLHSVFCSFALNGILIRVDNSSGNVSRVISLQNLNLFQIVIAHSNCLLNEISFINSKFSSAIHHDQNSSSISAIQSNISLKKSQIFNQSNSLRGGAIYFTAFSLSDYVFSKLNIERCVIMNNTAKFAGALYYEMKTLPLIMNNLIKNNKDTLSTQFYGMPNMAIVHFTFDANQESFIMSTTNELEINFNNLRSGTELVVTIVLFSNYQNEIKQYEEPIQFYIKSSIERHKMVDFASNFSYKMEPLKLNKAEINEIDLVSSRKVIFYQKFQKIHIRSNFHYRNCIPGEIFQNNYCTKCEAGTYSLKNNSLYCNLCKSFLICQGFYFLFIFLKSDGIPLKALQGYWRYTFMDDEAYFCINNPRNCNESISKLSQCTRGYLGPLCETCDYFGEYWNESYFSLAEYQCEKCDLIQQNYLKSIGSGLAQVCFLVGFSFLSKWGLIKMLTVEYLRYLKLFQFGVSGLRQLQGIYLKIMINHAQILVVLGSLNEIKSNFGTMSAFLSASSNYITLSTYSFDCLYKDYFKNANNLAFKIFLIYLAILIFNHIFIQLIHFVGGLVSKETIKFSISIFIFIFLFLQFYLDTADKIFSYFSCVSLGDQDFLLVQMSFRCYTDEHRLHIFAIMIPLFVLIIIVPIVAMFRKVNSIRKNRILYFGPTIRLGQIFIEYRVQYFEFIKIGQKLLIIIIFTGFLQNIMMRIILIVLVNVVYQSFSFYLNPFIRKQIFYLDQLSINILNISLLLGLMMLTTQNEVLRFVLVILIILFNFSFYLLLAAYFLERFYKRNQQLLSGVMMKLFKRRYCQKRADTFGKWKKLRRMRAQIICENFQINLQ